MKRMKKIMALMLAAIMMMAMSVTAFAAEGATGTLTLTVNVKTTTPAQDLKGQTINLYKLFDVTESGTTGSKNYAYTVNTETGYKDALASVLGSPITAASTDEQFAAAVLALGSNDSTKVQNFANKFTTYALTKSLAATATSGKIAEENKASYTFDNLTAGYYLVYVTGGKEIQSSLVTVDASTNTVNLKTEAPSINKTADKATAEIGQIVTYTVTGVIPDTTGFVMLFLVGNFIDISTIHAEAGSRTGSIQIIYKGRNSSDKEVTLSGAKFSIFPIQYMKNDELIWENGFKDSGISLQDTSAEAREKQAKQLFAFAKENNISGLMQETDTSGRTSFGELDEGIYLLAQIGNVESGTDKFESAPFLVNIPSEINGNVEYNVTIEPKAEWVSPETPPNIPDKPKDPTPSKPDKPNPIQKIINTVKTGDTTNIVAWFLIAIVSLGLIVGLYKKRKMK